MQSTSWRVFESAGGGKCALDMWSWGIIDASSALRQCVEESATDDDDDDENDEG
jgi:hypothetical protein